MTTLNPLLQLGAVELRDQLARGELRAVDLARACLDRIAAREPEVQAWAWLDSELVMRQAAARDAGKAVGLLHGLPVGIKDIIDTEGMGTENGTVLDAGRVPARDAVLVARLKQAGAVIMGKTVTTELANRAPGRTRNPHNPAHTPGGSSSGSAAAVADRMLPLAIGTQTAGSVIRPAAFCGVVGYKPSFGAIPRTGVLMQCPNLDTIGVFAHDVAGAALLAEAMFGCDDGDPAGDIALPPRLLEVALSEPAVAPTFAFVRQPTWDDADPETKTAFAAFTEALGRGCAEVTLTPPFATALAQHNRVFLAEMAKSYAGYEERGRERLSPAMRDRLDDGKRITARDYLVARDWPDILNAGLDAIFDRYDAILTPAAAGPALHGLDSTGDPAFNSLWTFCGTPAVSLPLLTAANGLPMGVQLVGRRGDDARLLRTARWLAGHDAAASRA